MSELAKVADCGRLEKFRESRIREQKQIRIEFLPRLLEEK